MTEDPGNRTPAPRAQLAASACGLLAATALTAPSAVADASGVNRPTAAQLTAAHTALARADVVGSARYTDAATGTMVVIADSTVDDGELTALTEAATTPSGAPEINRTGGKFTKQGRLAASTSNCSAASGAWSVSTCRTAQASSTP
ncbi:alpha-lytic protease prodomain-containing protein [Streptomyces sp. IB2014 016-6]|uniref:alpha-lytic protease prodomain-containing protein n=1 Tax=Streptomyces sp. IB2014 016-6 TaxID=2517818 RepID=UPI0011C961B6|nr:alpha-lytic protease prodomain-containing protein [Streptomyces sp. IB2014 016-6]TXL88618.1 hypothetical protein EW053_17935 [Streptomyces sp. IB2014 016-6]